MASIQLNGETVHLQDQALPEFQRMAQAVYSKLVPEENVRVTLARVLFAALQKEAPNDSPVVQTVLWGLHDLGVKKLRIDIAASRLDIDEFVDTQASRGEVEAFGVAAIETGRAYIAAISNVHRRVIAINGIAVRAFPQAKEEVEKVIAQMNTNRLMNEDLIFTSSRAIGGFISQGKGNEDPSYRAALEIAAGLGVLDIVIDFEKKILGVRQLSEANAAAMALLQGGNAKQVQQVRERIRKLAAQIEEMTRKGVKAAPPKPSDGKPEPPVPEAPEMRRMAIPAVIGSPRTKRRAT